MTFPRLFVLAVFILFYCPLTFGVSENNVDLHCDEQLNSCEPPLQARAEVRRQPPVPTRINPFWNRAITTSFETSLDSLWVNFEAPMSSQDHIHRLKLRLPEISRMIAFALRREIDTANTEEEVSSVQDQRKLLVLDLDQTLVHSIHGKEYDELTPENRLLFQTADTLVIEFSPEDFMYVRLRPGVRDFLQWANQHFRLAVFTAGIQIYADAVLQFLDPTDTLVPTERRRYRQSCSWIQDIMCLKDLTLFGEDLKQVILVDDTLVSFSKDPIQFSDRYNLHAFGNGLLVLPFVPQMGPFPMRVYEIELIQLKSVLSRLAPPSIEDVRPHLSVYLIKQFLDVFQWLPSEDK